MNTITLDTYAEKYDFKLLPSKQDYVSELSAVIQKERYEIRKTALKRKLKMAEICQEIPCDPISINIQRIYNRTCVVPPDLFIGGIEKKITYQRPWCVENSRGALMIPDSVYVGDLPDWVADRYERAKKYFNVDDLIVVSRNPQLFEHEAPFIKVSPLLIGFIHDATYLIAAWGLEHELPQSLGGLLPD